MKRRDFLGMLGATAIAGLGGLTPGLAWAAGRANYDRLLILVELKGGNDGLNTLVPFADKAYYDLRPKLAVRREDVLQLSGSAGFHPALSSLMPLWQGGELAVVQGVGYPNPNLSHFRSIEIWDTASKSEETLQSGWLARAFARRAPPQAFAADGVVIGSADIGPLTNGRRTVVLTNPEQFLKQAKLAGGDMTAGTPGKSALAHVMSVESDIRQAANRLTSRAASKILSTEFPRSDFGNVVKTAAQVLATGADVAVMRLTMGGFDTHQNQAALHANLLRQLAEGLAALRSALVELDMWQRTMVMTYAEFGRRPRENQSGGTDHGTSNVHFVLGGNVRGGLYGEMPSLSRLDGNGNAGFGVDYRSLYAGVLERWWGWSKGETRELLGGRFDPPGFVG